MILSLICGCFACCCLLGSLQATHSLHQMNLHLLSSAPNPYDIYLTTSIFLHLSLRSSVGKCVGRDVCRSGREFTEGDAPIHIHAYSWHKLCSKLNCRRESWFKLSSANIYLPPCLANHTATLGTLTKGTRSFNVSAAEANLGSNCLQWPHLWAHHDQSPAVLNFTLSVPSTLVHDVK